MTRTDRFTFLCDEFERQVITRLAIRLKRTQSDAVRYLIIQAMMEIEKFDLQGNSILKRSNQESQMSDRMN
jgi:hypothetical protein